MSEEYYVWIREEAVGPLSKEELFSMRSYQSVSEQTLVCQAGDSEWKPMGEVFPSAKSFSPAPLPPSLSSKRSQQDRELLRQYLVAVLRPQEESTYVPPSIKDALADAIPLFGNLLGRRKAVVAGTTVLDSQKEKTKREALFQQQRLLSLSATYMESAPWISYLTATKHSRFMECYGLTTSAFADFGDKKLVDETSRLADELEVQSSALMDSETSKFVRELIRFQERQERVKIAVSILNEMISSPHRGLIYRQLTNRKVEIERHDPMRETLPNGTRNEGIAVVSLFVATVLGVALVFSLAKGSNLGTPLVLMTATAVIVTGVFFGKMKKQREALKAEEDRYNDEKSREDQRIQRILEIVNGLAESFRTTVKPLLDELYIPINLDDFEGMLSRLVTYHTWGLKLKSRYTRT
jgi:hypothetical protein